MQISISELKSRLAAVLGDKVRAFHEQHGQLTAEIAPDDWLSVASALRDDPKLRFTTLIDVCGMDYSAYKEGTWEGARFAVVYNLLSIQHNCRVRVRVFPSDDDFPVVASIIDIWPGGNWFEREAFDLYGIVFQGHSDLRRLLTDYGFIGYPFRKDFPLSGNVEMRYDPDQKRVVYQPVTIEPREITPRIVREDNYAQNE